LSNGTGWGCISEYGDDTLLACVNTTMPADMTGVSDMNKCR